ncbi:sodium/potassium/calcium exchanger 1-like isoform X3 [Acanthopagrus latus]|uniref:sodium/potassium/calcium exchanger 1-like isoform X3 n=1 Tax=Acanthopagrus latus TaxID=8177 RepID=UPI00187BD1AF|nr:sodium/potassium/calcium exchanger 1-like isoform X3 [Acanthopagrus latus]
MNCTKKKLCWLQFPLSGVFVCTLYQLTISARLHEPLPRTLIGEDFGEGSINGVEMAQGLEEPLSATHELEPTDQTTSEMHLAHNTDTTTDFKAPTPPEITPSSMANPTFVAPEPSQETPTLQHIRSKYPADLFSVEDLRRGWVILHIFGMMYMFISLVTVCDEFFVPSLSVISDKLAISDDVTGATFMAAGRSISKVFALIIGLFFTHSNVGIGTIVGSAIYNILFVIGMCALFSRGVLRLTWWPLFRDVSFYILGLILLIIFFLDNVIEWWESLMLVTAYTAYVIFMKFNVQIEGAFKTQLLKHKNVVVTVEEPEQEDMPAGEEGSGGAEDAESDEDDIDKEGDNDVETEEKVKEGEEKNDKPLSLKWPDTPRKQATYLFLLPISLPLWLTVPDVRNQVGETFGISEEIMGLTILAAGTSIPDLTTSVIVARKGLGDTAMSSSLGSNIFNITVGLPLPLLLYSVIHGLVPVAVSSNGLLCCTMLLFISLLFVITCIASCKWKINRVLGLTMILLYLIFLVICVMLKYRIIVCPVSVG